MREKYIQLRSLEGQQQNVQIDEDMWPDKATQRTKHISNKHEILYTQSNLSQQVLESNHK